jgi:serine protease AprX
MTNRGVAFLVTALTVTASFLAAVPALFDDVRWQDVSQDPLGEDHIRTLWFNEQTVFHPSDAGVAQFVLDSGKNPGLGVRSLHQEGILGEGVHVAIIDQNLFLDHPELAGKIIGYWDLGCNLPPNQGSMHGPAVASLLVGESIGTAPGARVYYFAVPSWKRDAAYYAAALKEIRLLNSKMGANIRVVSVSATPSGPGSPYGNQAAWDFEAEKAASEGILVLDGSDYHGHPIAPCHYDPAAPEDVWGCTPGFAGDPVPASLAPGTVCAPSSFRTQAEEEVAGQISYQYTGHGGLSWSIPYVAGVLAMGWQTRPDLSAARMWELLLDTAPEIDGCHIVDPVAYVEAVRAAP